MKETFLEHARRNPWLICAWSFYWLMVILGSFKFLERSFIWTFNDKLLHFLAYACLSGLIFIGWRNKPFLPRLMITLGILSVLAAIDEILQNFTGRDPSFDDWLADMAGAILSLIVLTLYIILRWLWQTYRSGNWSAAFAELIHPGGFEPEED